MNDVSHEKKTKTNKQTNKQNRAAMKRGEQQIIDFLDHTSRSVLHFITTFYS